MKINEVFLSCQGEGLSVGLPFVFVRFQGCNLNPGCSWCDTKYAQKDGGEEATLAQLLVRIDEVKKGVRCTSVCITGGEPLYQASEVYELVRALRVRSFHVYRIEVFTNGTLELPRWYKQVRWCVDVKCPSSKTNIDIGRYTNWFRSLRYGDSIKFVVADEEDLKYCVKAVKYMRDKMPLSETQRFVSPAICGDVVPSNVLTLVAAQAQQKWLQRVWEFCVQNDLRFSLQNHKVVFGNRKGV